MKKKINLRLMSIAALAIITTLILVSAVFYDLFQKQIFADLKAYCRIIVSGEQMYEERNLHLSVSEQIEQLEAYEPYFLYYDKAVLEELSNIDYTAEVIPEIALPDPSKPELMEEPVPVMIDVSSSEKISVFYPVSKETYAFAFVVNGMHKEKAVELLEYLM